MAMDPKTYLVLLHLTGLVIGLGSVTTLDLYLLKFLRGDAVTESDAHLVDLVSKLAALGLAALWVSGLGFLYLLWTNTPGLLPNPKLMAKIVVVGILTINGAFLHFTVLPLVRKSIGRNLFCKSGAKRDRIAIRVCGTISAASWWTPFVLGTVRELNFAAPIWVFLGFYAGALVVCGLAFTLTEHWLAHFGDNKTPAERADPAPRPAAAEPAASVYAMDAPRRGGRLHFHDIETQEAMHEEKSFLGARSGDPYRRPGDYPGERGRGVYDDRPWDRYDDRYYGRPDDRWDDRPRGRYDRAYDDFTRRFDSRHDDRYRPHADRRRDGRDGERHPPGKRPDYRRDDRPDGGPRTPGR